MTTTASLTGGPPLPSMSVAPTMAVLATLEDWAVKRGRADRGGAEQPGNDHDRHRVSRHAG